MFKRLEQGHFKWPNDETETLMLNFYELKLLINSPGVEQKLKRKKLFVINNQIKILHFKPLFQEVFCIRQRFHTLT